VSHDDVFDLPEDRRFDGTRESEFPPENRESWLEPEFAEGQSITRHWGWLLVLGIAWMLFELSADPAIISVQRCGCGGAIRISGGVTSVPGFIWRPGSGESQLSPSY
jgi:hypothetical protein